MKLWNTNICLTSPVSILIIAALLFSTIVLANVWPKEVVIIKEVKTEEDKMWIPTKEDIAYQDSMFCIIEQTQMDIDTIKQDIDKILYKLDRLEYDDGTYDSIRMRK